MKKVAFILTLLLSISFTGWTQQPAKAYKGSDGIPVCYSSEDVVITAPAPTKKQKKKAEKKVAKFNKLKYTVMKVWPYANEAAKNLIEINAQLATLPGDDARKDFLKSKENSLFGDYEEEIKDLTFSQGKVLIKLIDRQTGSTTYSLIRDLKSGSAAFFWNAMGKVFGYSLKDEYDPAEDPEIEVICLALENGIDISYYDYVAMTTD